MRLLAIDTALEACSVAVLDGEGEGARLTAASELLKRGHAERLMDMIGEVMAEAGLAFSELDRIAVTIGPGSFTGLRVGLSAARGLALVVGVPAVGISTLEAIGEAARQSGGEAAADAAICAVIDARGPDVYAQSFAADGSALTPARVVAVEALAAELTAGTLLAGSGADKLAAAMTGPAPVILDRAGFPEIGAVARLGARAETPESAPEPLYLRPPDAKPAVRAPGLLA
ncbi:tRNA (adenosine(37)-N6)-threonylcarbamoyltransferase complex dimerization subunit type 1 TsaB [Stappia indica]|uniref:tRNA (adenosine(37)-N6)-threonylcarbamoyltransferase complex dimerization subunit type 1 TsaB n=1 Tax=Stappia indica TaxID=538381 RepID=UPI001CD692D8|nr:tRNA (adenosine(37)-N6)-threonylcarbamoyltransferase complex dimerization subunit type 1 TsaB [Stappia indica]MCA1300503.1 tRNA (adenosine(37)-N6)-threonylcarbamoyltransferase complex dimerization subunit type 1 TsaB [Stappia indica]